MELKKFDYDLPQELIAQQPPKVRGTSRLMTLDKISGEVNHRSFTDLPGLLKPGDILVLNDSKVLPARLFGKKQSTGAAVEVVLLKDTGRNRWECLVRPGRKIRTDNVLEFGGGRLKGKIMAETEFGGRVIEFYDYGDEFFAVLDELGEMPLPPYITKELEDRDRYQTVYAKNLGSAAAPTAGLHFTEELLLEMKGKGVNVCYITLHVGLGTFRPVKVESIEDHQMHAEYYEISEQSARTIACALENSRRIVAVGTTCVRTLESVASAIKAGGELKGWTDIFIYPGYSFQVVDAMITNFHLPKSTLIMMVSAFAGREPIMEAYRQAVEKRYRFFSFGDAMYIY
jgi:S-adenosylmethionine:tRNA ribosyltransferase-isomerase